MRFDIITIFPKIFDSYFSESIIKRAVKTKKIRIKIWNLRDFAHKKNLPATMRSFGRVDDRPYGGGTGMVLQVEPILRAVQKIKPNAKTKIIILSAKGKQFNQKIAGDWAAKYRQIILISGRYEGIDERVKIISRAEEISIGPYVLTGGEIPAMAIVDAVSRHIPGVLGKSESLEEKRYGIGVSAYTRPEIFSVRGSAFGGKNKKYKVPEVLLSGNHKKIENWRIKHKMIK